LANTLRKFLKKYLVSDALLLAWQYANQCWPLVWDGPGKVLSLCSQFPAWLSAQRPYELTIANAKPWYNFSCVAFLERHLRPGMSVFEYGSGASTVYFSKLGLEGTSIEHDPAWATRIQDLLRQAGSHWQVIYVLADAEPVSGPSDPSDVRACHSAMAPFSRTSFRSYVHAIDAFATGSLDLITVDGRSRPSCLMASLSKLKSGGMLLLDDSERERYGKAMAQVPSSWKRLDFFGPKAAKSFARTTIWWKPG
jgi:hypothetical protein